MSKTICMLAVWAMLSAAAVGAEPREASTEATPGELLASAQTLYDHGQYAEAAEALNTLQQVAPQHPGADELRGRVQAAMQREKASLHRAAAFTDDASDNPPVRAESDAAQKMREAAQPASKPVKNAQRLYEHAEALLDRGQYDAARSVLSEIEPSDDVFDRARMLRARIDAWEAMSQRRGEDAGGQKAEMDEDLKRKLARDLLAARSLFVQKRWRECIDTCERIRRYAPYDPRARQLLRDASIELTDVRVQDIEANSERRIREALGEAAEIMVPPRSTARLTRPTLEPEVRVPTADEIAIEKKLNEKVSMDLIEAPLSYVLDLLSRSIGINLIVDPAAVQDKTVTINVKNTTLQEVLDFIARNESVTFTKGRNTIYVTTPGEPMLELRIFHLNKGLTDVANDIMGSASTGGTTGGGGGGTGGGGNATAGGGGAKPSDTSDIERLLERIETGLITWPAGSQYYLDRKRNVLFLRSTPKTLDQVEKMIMALDENPIQVLVTTRFIEIDAENLDDLGVEWNLTNDFALTKKGGADSLVIDASTGTNFDARVATEAGNTVSSSDGLTIGLTGILTDPQFQATLKIVSSKYKGRVVNAPQVVARNNSPARFQETQDLWYVDDYRIDRTDLTGSEGVTTSEPVVVPQFARGPSIGFGLTVTPSVGRDSRDITLLLEPIFRRKSLDSVSQPVILPSTLGAASDIVLERPVIVDRRMWAKVTVRDGYHVALGGMVTGTKKEIESKVPLLGDLPLIGFLFRRKSVIDARRHLLVFVSARILDPTGDMYKTDDQEREEALRKAELSSKKPSETVGVDYVRADERRQILRARPALGRWEEDEIIDLEELKKR
jgi:type II secretory pathway component GspD/PulD (secretin)